MKDGKIFAMFFNGGPRKGWNTFKMLEEAKRAYRDEHFEKDLENAKNSEAGWSGARRNIWSKAKSMVTS